MVRRVRRPRDVQRDTVYRWENSYLAPDRSQPDFLRKDNARAFLKQVCAEIHCCPPMMRWGNQNYLTATGGRKSLTFPDNAFGRSKAIMLHELAHHIVIKRRDGDNRHGPWWVGTFIELCAQYAGWDRAAMLESAALEGVAVGTSLVY